MSLPASQAKAIGALMRLTGAALFLAATQGHALAIPAALAAPAWLVGLMAVSEIVRSGVRLAILAGAAVTHSPQAPPRRRAISQEAPI